MRVIASCIWGPRTAVFSTYSLTLITRPATIPPTTTRPVLMVPTVHLPLSNQWTRRRQLPPRPRRSLGGGRVIRQDSTAPASCPTPSLKRAGESPQLTVASPGALVHPITTLGGRRAP